MLVCKKKSESGHYAKIFSLGFIFALTPLFKLHFVFDMFFLEIYSYFISHGEFGVQYSSVVCNVVLSDYNNEVQFQIYLKVLYWGE